ncbi:unnamed protein product, partial [Brachionus calyciflorus]
IWTNIYDRKDELKRCSGVIRPEMIRPIIDKSSKNSKLIIRVNSYDDFKLLTGNWPIDSFKSGVNVQPNIPLIKCFNFDC